MSTEQLWSLCCFWFFFSIAAGVIAIGLMIARAIRFTIDQSASGSGGT